MNRWIRFSGILGVVLLIFGILGGLVLGFGAGSSVQVLMMAHVVLGTAAIITWFLLVGLKSIKEGEQSIKGRSARFGANLALYTTVFVGLLVALRYLTVNSADLSFW